MRLGISTYALTWSIGVDGYPQPENNLTEIGMLETAKNLDVDVVQFADNLPLHKLSTERLKQLADTAQAMQLVLEVGTRGTNQETLLEYLSVAKAIKSNVVRTIINKPNFEEATQDIIDVLPKFVEAGVTLAIENHGLQSVPQLVGLFELVKSPYLGCCLDTVNSFEALEGYSEVVQALSPYVVNLHVKDFEVVRQDHNMGLIIKGTPTGQGRLDVPRLLNIISSNNRDPNAIVELWTPYLGTVKETIDLENEWLTTSVAYLKSLSSFSVSKN